MVSLRRAAGIAGLTGLLVLIGDRRPSGAQDAVTEGWPDVVRVEVKSVWTPDPRINVVFLKSLKTRRVLPVWIGPYEAEAIQMKLSGATFPSPLTHDLLKSLIEVAGAKVRYVLVDALRATGGRDSGTYFAKITLSLKGGGSTEIDSRTSDAIALSVRTGTPIYVSAGIMEGNSIADESELESELMGKEKKSQKPSEKPEKKERKAGKDYY
ncbi:bifunctional nuclease family protein [bacterium]|nr:bifunctional nuclease family protein [bacterium]